MSFPIASKFYEHEGDLYVFVLYFALYKWLQM